MEKPTEGPEKREGTKNAKVDSAQDAKQPNSIDKLKHLIKKLLKHNTSDYYPDLLRIFEMFDEKKDGSSCFARYFIFLGDYVDRGKNSLECILLLLALKLLHPERALEGQVLFVQFNDLFNYLPLACVISNKFLCMHGGISPSLKSLDDIRALKKPIDVMNSPLVTDLLWADPMYGLDGFTKNKLRGVSVNFGEDVLASLLESLGLKLVIRGHQMMYEGFNFFGDRKLITVFSAPAYHPSIKNPGAVLQIGKDGKIGFKTLAARTAERIFRGVEEGEEAHCFYGYIYYASEAEQLGSLLSGMSTSLSKK